MLRVDATNIRAEALNDFRSSAAEVSFLESRHTPEGAAFVPVTVVDEYDRPEYIEARAALQMQMDGGEAFLHANPEVGYDHAPRDPHASDKDWEAFFDPLTHAQGSVAQNPVRSVLYNSSTMRAWRRNLVPSARALFPLQRPEIEVLPDGTPVDAFSRELFRHSYDAIGIRSRAQIMSALSVAHAREFNGTKLRWMSLACGAAVPVLDAVRDIKKYSAIESAHLTLVDMDPTALDFATELAINEYGLTDDDFTVERRNLIKDLIIKNTLAEDKGKESFDMIDMLGIFEYMDDRRAIAMLRNAYELVAVGGHMIIGNMLQSHPQLQTNQRAIGWPGIKPRTLAEVKQLIAASGIPLSHVNAYIPQDGVYAVLQIEKRACVRQATEPRHFGATALHLLA